MTKKTILLFAILLLAALLRFVWLDRFPSALYTDEADQGWNAYSVLTTGKDEHGTFMPLSFRSFGDWKPPLQTYLMVPFAAMFGLNEWTVRLPSALLGIGTVFLTYLIAQQWTGFIGKGKKIGLLAAFLLAVSPWHILQSRSAMLVAVTLFFLLLAVWLTEKAREKAWFLIPASVSFVLAIYGYYGMRVVVPLLLLFYAVRFRDLLLTRKREAGFALLAGIILLTPLFVAFFRQPDVVFGRARTVSVFYDQGVKLRQWELITQDGISENTLITRLSHNSYYLYARSVISRYVSHFNPDYLFLRGDNAQPFQISSMGILYAVDGALILIALVAISWQARMAGLFAFLAVAIVPAAFTFLTPSSNRSFSAVVPLCILAAAGISRLFTRRRAVLFPLLMAGIYIVSLQFFLRQYFFVMPTQHPGWWNWGWKNVAEYVRTEESKYDSVVVLDRGGMPYIYFLVYGEAAPRFYQDNAVRTYVADRFGFEHVEGFGKYIFLEDRSWNDIKGALIPGTLYVIPASEMTDKNIDPQIRYPDGSPAFYMVSG